MSLDLRPLTLGELLDRSFSLYRRYFWTFVGLMAIPSLLTLIVALSLEILPEVARVASESEPDPATIALAIGIGGFAMLAVVIAYWCAYMVALGATTVAVADLYAGQTPTIGSAYARMRGRVGRLMLLFVLIMLRLLGIIAGCGVLIAVMTGGAMVVLGRWAAALGIIAFMAVIVAASFYALRYCLSVPALVLEHVTASEAIRRSVWLVRGNYWRALVLAIFATLITYAAMAIFQVPFAVAAVAAGPESRAGFWLNLVGTLTGTFGSAISAPLMIIALALLYYDARIRKEGLDLQVMIAALDVAPAAPSHGSQAFAD